nr:MAG TPA: duffy receptor-like protein [Caudoviricetes sp.]
MFESVWNYNYWVKSNFFIYVLLLVKVVVLYLLYTFLSVSFT